MPKVGGGKAKLLFKLSEKDFARLRRAEAVTLSRLAENGTLSLFASYRKIFENSAKLIFSG